MGIRPFKRRFHTEFAFLSFSPSNIWRASGPPTESKHPSCSLIIDFLISSALKIHFYGLEMTHSSMLLCNTEPKDHVFSTSEASSPNWGWKPWCQRWWCCLSLRAAFPQLQFPWVGRQTKAECQTEYLHYQNQNASLMLIILYNVQKNPCVVDTTWQTHSLYCLYLVSWEFLQMLCDNSESKGQNQTLIFLFLNTSALNRYYIIAHKSSPYISVSMCFLKTHT